jgi:hypothetical protein
MRGARAVELASLILVGITMAHSQDISLSNKTATFTNLEGRLFEEVQLVGGDWDGVIWRKRVGGGRVCYTNLNPALLEAWEIPTNRIGIARARAERKALSDARDRVEAQIQAQQDIASRAKTAAQEAAAIAHKAAGEQRKADAEAIERLTKQIEETKQLLRRAKAAAHDYNQANRYNRLAPRYYVKESERVRIEEAEMRLKKMKADFATKYSVGNTKNRE